MSAGDENDLPFKFSKVSNTPLRIHWTVVELESFVLNTMRVFQFIDLVELVHFRLFGGAGLIQRWFHCNTLIASPPLPEGYEYE